MVKMTGKRSNPVEKNINFVLKRGSTVKPNSVKKIKNRHIKVPKKQC